MWFYHMADTKRYHCEPLGCGSLMGWDVQSFLTQSLRHLAVTKGFADAEAADLA